MRKYNDFTYTTLFRSFKESHQNLSFIIDFDDRALEKQTELPRDPDGLVDISDLLIDNSESSDFSRHLIEGICVALRSFTDRSEERTSELQSSGHFECR